MQREFVISDCELWYLRMEACIPLDIFAVGNKQGKLFVYNLSGSKTKRTDVKRKGVDGSRDDNIVFMDEKDSHVEHTSSFSGSKGKGLLERFEMTEPQKAGAILTNPRLSPIQLL